MADFFSFLRLLSENNNRPWFEENRDRYEKARSEVEAIVSNCIQEIARFEDLGDLTPKQAMFRIYRDVRFSKNKEPFKKNFSAMISRDGKRAMSGFGYYIHFEPEESFMAEGEYEPTPEQLAKIRQEIDYNPEEFRAIIEDPDFVQKFGGMQGKQLKTAPKGYPKDHPEIDLLRFTQFYFMHRFSNEQMESASFPEQLALSCRQIRPFLEFLNRAQN